MLERIAPHLAMIGIHKNGTWAAQKIIECVQTPEEVQLVTQNIRPYVPPLLLDQFGNYVVQYVYFCCTILWDAHNALGVAFDLELRPLISSSKLWLIDSGRLPKDVSEPAV